MSSALDFQQILQKLFDEESQSIGVGVKSSANKVSIQDKSLYLTNLNTEILPENLNRNYLFIQNLSSKPIWINFGQAATNTLPSICLTARQSFSMTSGTISTDPIYAISELTNSPLVIKEG